MPGRYQSKYYIVDVEEFLRQQLDEPAILFGLSTGGAVALAVAAKCPENGGRVTLTVDGAGTMDPAALKRLAGWLGERVQAGKGSA